MPIRFNCQNPNCPHPALKVGDQYAGQRAQCPNCGTINIVPMQEELVLPPLPPPPAPPYRSPYADIFEAAEKGTFMDVKYFVESGVKVNVRTEGGRTPLQAAVRNNNALPVLQYLISQDADINSKNACGVTPLISAVMMKCDFEVVRFLVDHHADITVQDFDFGNSIIHYAVINHPDPRVLQLLIDRGADVNMKNRFGSTPMEHVCAEGITNAEEKERILRRAGGRR